MPDFPRSIGVHMSSQERVINAALVSRSRAGRIRARRLYPASVREFSVALRGLTNAERDTVMNFLAANCKLPFGFFWPYGAGAVYQVIWTDSDVKWEDVGGKLSATNLTFSVVS